MITRIRILERLKINQSQRGVVFFRNQDLTLERQHEFTKHFGIVRPFILFYNSIDNVNDLLIVAR